MMVAKSLKWALACGVIVAPPAALALGLGDIHLNSALNAPLDADIELLGATPDELASLKPQIASRELFAKYGLEWPAFLSGVTLRAVHTADGHDLIKLHSAEAITDPFVTLLVEVNGDHGHVVREYTLLLDPPVYAPNPNQVASAPVAAPAAGAAAHEGSIERATPSAAPAESAATAAPAAATAPATETAATEKAPSAEGEGSTASSDTYNVRRGDTLSSLAAHVGKVSGADAKRWMVAAYQANPTAFEHNMNLLHAGAVLRIPDAAAIEAVTPNAATSEVRRQYAAWHSAAPAAASTAQESGRLRLVAPENASASAPAAGAAGQASKDVKTLQGEVQQLQSQLDESRRLLEMRNTELAELQAKLAAHQGTALAPTPPVSPAKAAGSAAPAAAAARPAAVAPAPAVSPAPAPAPAVVAQPAPPPVATPVPAPAPTAAPAAAPPVAHVPVNKPPAAHEAAKHPAPPAPQGSFLDTLLDYWWVLALAVAGALAFFGLRFFRSRREAVLDDDLGRLAAAGAEALSHDREPTFSSPPPVPRGRENNFLVEESGAHERPRFNDEAHPAPAARHVASDETISSETAINLDQGDPLAEADFHMAYGLYDQAADLVRIAIQREPQRRDLRLKLLEVFFVWGNKEQFLLAARELADSRAQAAPGEWEKIVIMGKQLAPEDPLFAGGSGSGAAAGGVDLNLEAGQNPVDFDVLGEGSGDQRGGEVDLDIGTAIGARDPALGSPDATDRNLALQSDDTADTAEHAVGSTATTRQMTAKIGRSAANGTEGPTVEQPALGRTVVTPRPGRPGANEHTTELALDDLGLDLGALDAGADAGAAAASDAPTMVGGLDENSRRILESAQKRAKDENAAELRISETGSWHFDGSDLEEAQAGGAEPPHADPSAATLVAPLGNGNTVDFDVGEAGGHTAYTKTIATNGHGVDLDVGTATVPDVAYTATQRLGNDDLALPDLDPVTMSEVGTKLDLARAYMDMGDPEGARNILEEVMNEGSVAQKQEAQRLIEALPG